MCELHSDINYVIECNILVLCDPTLAGDSTLIFVTKFYEISACKSRVNQSYHLFCVILAVLTSWTEKRWVYPT